MAKRNRPRASVPPVQPEKPKPLAQACGSCVFIERSNPSDIFCRRYPPRLTPVQPAGYRSFYPNVHPELDFCGEHRSLLPLADPTKP
jgi:hypothetical protein